MKHYVVHEGTENYMIIDGEKDLYEDDYRIKMLKNNRIGGLLEFKTKYINNKAEYYYDITSKKSLKNIAESGKFGYEEIIMIAKELNRLINEVKRYLLPPENIILDYENIYIDLEQKKVFFCYNPVYALDIEDGIRELFRNFLELIDHSDRRTVELAYDIYCKVMKENFTINGIIENIENMDNIVDNSYTYEDNYKSKSEEVLINDDYYRDEKGNTIFGNIKEFIKGVFAVDNTVVNENAEFFDETMLLCDSGKNADDIYICFTNVENGEVLCIPGVPCVIGKSVDKCDVIINEDVISRVHAKLVKNNGEIFIEDMHSSNGTFVNDVKLQANKQILLRENDRIRLADIEYIYQQVH